MCNPSILIILNEKKYVKNYFILAISGKANSQGGGREYCMLPLAPNNQFFVVEANYFF